MVTMAEYMKWPAVSSSRVKAWAQHVPAKAKWMLDHPKESRALSLGTVSHSAILEPDTLERHYVVLVKPNLRTKAGKAEWKAMHEDAAAAGKTVVSQDDFDLARAMRDAVRAHPAAATLLRKGEAELSRFALDEEFGCDLKSREDWCPPFDVITDLKTCRDADKWFGHDAIKFGYHISAYHYRRVRHADTGKWADFAWIAVESEPPHLVRVWYCPDDMMLWAEHEWREAMTTMQACEKAGKFPGYTDEPHPLPMPGWLRQRAIDEGVIA